MKTLILVGLSAGALLVLSTPALAGDAAHGPQLFRAQK